MIRRETTAMRRVIGEHWTKPFGPGGPDVCVADAKVQDFRRTTWRIGPVPIWWRDDQFVDVPLFQFINDCLGTGQ